MQTEAHAGGSGALVQFIVDSLDLTFGIAQQLLHCAGDLCLQMVLEHLTFAGREEFSALGNFSGQARTQLVRTFRAVLVDDADD